jgi:hypothetical protein
LSKLGNSALAAGGGRQSVRANASGAQGATNYIQV